MKKKILPWFMIGELEGISRQMGLTYIDRLKGERVLVGIVISCRARFRNSVSTMTIKIFYPPLTDRRFQDSEEGSKT